MMLAILTIFLVLVYGLKFTAIVNAIRWLIRRGCAYRIRCKECGPDRPEAFYACFDALDGGFFPFGVKDYLLRRFTNQQKSRTTRVVLETLRNNLFRYDRLTLITCCYLVLSIVGKINMWPAMTQPASLLYTLGLSIIICNIAISVEALVSYTVLGNYALLFHMVMPPNGYRDASTLRLKETWLFFSKFMLSIATGGIVTFITQLLYQGFSELVQPGSFTIGELLGSLLDCVYFTLSTFLTVGYGDVHPVNRYGRVVASLIMTQGFILIICVFASLQSSKFEETTVV